MSNIMRAAVNERRTFLINKLNKGGYDTLSRLSDYTLSDLEAANIRHTAEMGRIMTRRLEHYLHRKHEFC